jgi:hypothetical protein
MEGNGRMNRTHELIDALRKTGYRITPQRVEICRALAESREHASPQAIYLSRRAQRVVWRNLVFAMLVIAMLVISNLIAGVPLPLGVVGHEGSTLVVVANGLRLLRPLRV